MPRKKSRWRVCSRLSEDEEDCPCKEETVYGTVGEVVRPEGSSKRKSKSEESQEASEEEGETAVTGAGDGRSASAASSEAEASAGGTSGSDVGKAGGRKTYSSDREGVEAEGTGGEEIGTGD